jgi:hypothetical protein
MKKILLTLCFLLITFPAWATNYYACQNAQNVTGDNTWCAYAALESGSPAACTKAAAGSYTAWATVVADSPTLYANGCASVVVNDSFTAIGISTADAGGGTNDFAGGTFTLDLASVSGKTFTTNITAGTTPALTVTGNAADANPAGTIQGNLLGGGSAAAYAVSDAHTNGTIVIGSSGTPVTLTGGGNATAYSFYSSSSGAFLIYGESTAANSPALYSKSTAEGVINGNSTATYEIAGVTNSSTGTITHNGDCISRTSTGVGCNAPGAGAFTVTGSIISGARALGASGTIIWAPSSAKKYIKFAGGGTPIYASAYLASDSAGTKVTPANTAAEIKTTSWFIKSDDYDGSTLTQGTATAGSGGSYAY